LHETCLTGNKALHHTKKAALGKCVVLGVLWPRGEVNGYFAITGNGKAHFFYSRLALCFVNNQQVGTARKTSLYNILLDKVVFTRTNEYL